MSLMNVSSIFTALLQVAPNTAPVINTAELTVLFQKAGISLLIGALIGIERERDPAFRDQLFAGLRTFPLIALLGFLSGLLGYVFSPVVYIVLAAGFLGLIIVSYVFSVRQGWFGSTSEVTAILVFVLGTLVFWEFYALSIAAAVVVMLFLSLKAPLQRFLDRVNTEDIYATIKFAIITTIVLPILPNETMGPLDVLNPRHIWYMVVLIAGISFAGYLLVKIYGSHRGISLTGLLGGLVSSTAVTLSFSQKSREAEQLSRTFASAIILACTIMYPRVLLQVAVVNQSLLAMLWPHLAGLTAAGVLVSLWLMRGSRSQQTSAVKLENPFELKSAIKFGLVFAVILFVAKAGQMYFGDNGVYLAAALAGITDVDAITLSMASLAKGAIAETTASTAILLAIVTNTLVKAGMSIMLGAVALRRYAIPGFGVLFLTGAAMVVWLVFQ